MPAFRAPLVIISVGVLTFGLVFTLLEFSRTSAAPAEPVEMAAPTAVPLMPVSSAESLAQRVAPGQLAIGVPIAGSEPLLRDVQPGDRLDVLASLPSPQSDRPVTAVVVTGATVLRPATSTDPLLVEVPASDAIVLAHLILGGTHLGYLVLPPETGSAQ